MTINADGRLWKVNNYEGEYLGRINLTQAIAYSDNSVFSQLTALVGPRSVRDTARALGITTKLNGYFAIGLGAEPATPLEMARAYASFADGGFRVDGSIFGDQPRAISKIQDSKGNVDGERRRREAGADARRRRRRSTSCSRASCSSAPARRRSCRAARSRARPARPRTTATPGSSATRRSSSTAVWVGYPDKLVPMTTEFHGKPVAGGTFPALIWKAFMQKALAKLPPETFTPPDYGYAAPVTVVNRGGILERDDGVCHNTAQLEFFGGEVATAATRRVATCKANEVEIPDTVGMSLADARARLQGPAADAADRLQARAHRAAARRRRRPAPARGTARPATRSRSCCAKSLHGVVPNLVGLLAGARAGEARAAQARRLDARRRPRQGDQAVASGPHTASAPGREDRAHRARNGRLTKREPARP